MIHAHAPTPQHTTLPALIVSSQHHTHTPEKNTHTVGNQVVISQQRIQQSGAQTLTQVLQNVAGVQVSQGVSPNPMITIRGKPALIILNGVPFAQFSMLPPDLNLIPLHNLKTIVITPGSAGVIYGDQAIGGVINLITTLPQHLAPFVQIAGRHSWLGQVTASIENRWHHGWFARVGAQSRLSQGYRDHNRNSTTQENVLLGKVYQTGQWWLQFWSMKQTYQYPGFLTVSQLNHPTQADKGQGSFDPYNQAFQVNWQQQISSYWRLRNVADYRQQWGTMYYDNKNYQQDYRTLDWRPQLNGTVMWGRRAIHIKFGLVAMREDYGLSNSIHGGYRNQYAAFLWGNMPLTSTLSLQGGDRALHALTSAQYYDSPKKHYHPRSYHTDNLNVFTVGLTWKFAYHWYTYLRRAGGYQMPFVDQQNSVGSVVPAFTLKPETSVSYEWGLHWQQHNDAVNLETYWLQDHNQIDYSTKSNINMPDNIHKGISASGQYYLTSVWRWLGSMTYQQAQFTGAPYQDKTVPDVPSWLGRLNTHYQFTPDWGGMVETLYTGNQYADSDFGNHGGTIPAYWLVNAAIDFHHGPWRLTMRLDNLLNQRYFNYVSYSQYVNGDIAYYPAAGRTLWLTMSYAP